MQLQVADVIWMKEMHSLSKNSMKEALGITVNSSMKQRAGLYSKDLKINFQNNRNFGEQALHMEGIAFICVDTIWMGNKICVAARLLQGLIKMLGKDFAFLI